jgi:hypothetical protein
MRLKVYTYLYLSRNNAHNYLKCLNEERGKLDNVIVVLIC